MAAFSIRVVLAVQVFLLIDFILLMKIFLKTEDEIELMRKANRLVGATLAELAKHIKPGVTTLQLDKVAEELIRDNGAVPTFKNFPIHLEGRFPQVFVHRLTMS